jgi:hypothetical protein
MNPVIALPGAASTLATVAPISTRIASAATHRNNRCILAFLLYN